VSASKDQAPERRDGSGDRSEFRADHSPMIEFKYELQQLLNKYNIDAITNTPDFMLADLMVEQLAIWRTAHDKVRKWHGVRYPLEHQQLHVQEG